MVQTLLEDKDFQELASKLVEEGYNAGHIHDAFLFYDDMEAGEIGDGKPPEVG